MKPFWRIFLFLLVFTACLAYMSRVVCDFGVAYWHNVRFFVRPFIAVKYSTQCYCGNPCPLKCPLTAKPEDYGAQWKLKCRDYEYPQDLQNAQPYYSTEEIHKI